MADQPKTPEFRILAVVRDPSKRDADPEWIPIGALWPTRNADVYTGRVTALPVSWLQPGHTLEVAIRRNDADDRSSGRRRN